MSKWLSEPVIAACESCGKRRIVQRRAQLRIESGKRKNLCRSCGARSRSKYTVAARDKVAFVCPDCGDERIITGKTLHQIEAGRLLGYCKECARKKFLTSLLKYGEDHPRWNGGSDIVICEWCGKEFEVKAYRSRNGKGARFCSRKCQGKWQSKNWIGQDNPAWKGGKSFETYPPAFDKALKTAIRERDNYTCAFCGKYGYIVHHIDYNKNNAQINNLVALCEVCHGKTGASRVAYTAILSDKVSDMPFAGFAYY